MQYWNKLSRRSTFFILDLRKCTDDCSNENEYIYSYGGQCFKECPKYTKLSDNGKSCVDNNDNFNKCILSETKLELEGNSLFETVKIMAKNCAQEFGYTKKHASYY